MKREGSEDERSTESNGSGGDGGGGSCGSGKTTTLVLKKGPWTAAEDSILMEYVKKHGEGNWNAVQRNSGLARCGKSCRLRWANHLRPNLKKGTFSPQEERLILELHSKLGNKWARMASQLPGRTDNEIKNYWNTRVKRRLRQGLPLYPQDIQNNASGYHHQNITNTQTQNLFSSSPLSQSPLVSPHQATPTYNSSLSLFDANTHANSAFSFLPPTPPPLSLPSNRFKRHHNMGVDFSVQYSSRPQLPSHLGQSMSVQLQPSSPLGQSMPILLQPSSPLGQSMFTQFPHVSSFPSGSAIFDKNSAQFLQSQYKPEDGSVPSTRGLAFSVKPELPSSQLSQTTMQYDADKEMKLDTNVARNGSGLLDDLLREAQVISSGEELRTQGLSGSEQEKGFLDGFNGHWEYPSSVQSALGMKTKEEQVDQNNSMGEDLLSILNNIPHTMQIPISFCNTGEVSKEQSFDLSGDNLGIDMQHLTSSLQLTAASWDNMPGIC